MIGFFSIIIGYLVFLAISYYSAKKIGIEKRFYRNDRKEYAIKYNKPVWFGRMEGDKTIYLETRSGKEVYQDIDKYGLKRWYYIKTEQPMQYPEDKRIMQSLIHNKTIALSENKKWCIAEYFWDDSIIRLQNDKPLLGFYLDDFTDRNNPFEVLEWNNYVRNWNKENPDKPSKRIIRSSNALFRYSNSKPEQKEKYKEYFYYNNPLHQKVYLKNMRPYQLYLIGETGTGNTSDPIKYKQYLIRFGKEKYFDFKTQHCISDKQASVYWTKWYAISELEYLNLTVTEKGMDIGYVSPPLDSVTMLMLRLKPINLEDIAYEKEIKKPNWELKNWGIQRAFDNEGNFIKNII